jgi:hypothetical protein
VNFGSYGVGGSRHLSVEYFDMVTGVTGCDPALAMMSV